MSIPKKTMRVISPPVEVLSQW